MVTCTSVLMAKAASLALAAIVIHRLNINGCSFLSDCEQLVQFLNKADCSTPPDWRIKPFTQTFLNHARTMSSQVFKISRNHNTKTNVLASQALNSQASHLEKLCSFEHCFSQCFVVQALQSVDLNDVTILAPRCC